jgi:hypothetical protein
MYLSNSTGALRKRACARLHCAVTACFGLQSCRLCDGEDDRNVIGLLVKGPGGDEHLVTTVPDRATSAVLMFRRDASGWVPAS